MSDMKDMPAFPCGRDVTLEQFAPTSGMTLRDYFAAKALAALLGCPEVTGTAGFFAEESYRFADAMMEARKA